MRNILRGLGCAVVLTVAACSNVVDTSAAEREVARFHQMLDSDQGAEIYSASSDDLRKAVQEKEFVALISAVHRKPLRPADS